MSKRASATSHYLYSILLREAQAVQCTLSIAMDTDRSNASLHEAWKLSCHIIDVLKGQPKTRGL